MRVWLTVISVCILIAGLLAFYKYQQIQAGIEFGRSFPESVESVEYFIVREELWQPETAVTGEALATRSVDLASEVAGTIVEVGFAPGAAVAAGQVLIRLDSREEQAQLAAARAETEITRLEFTRYEKLIRTGAAAQESRDQAKARYDAAMAVVQRLLAVIDKKTLRAPFPARTGLHRLEPGLYLDKGTLITRLVGAGDELWIDFSLPQEQAALEMGEEVMVSRGEQGVSRTARIIAKDAFVSEASRNVRYRAVLDNRDIGIVAGALVAVQVPLGDVRVAAVVPITSVRRDSFGARVFVLRPAEEGARAPERAEVRLVSLGPQRGDMVIVAKGLQTGEKIAAGGAFKLRDGVLVNAIPATHALTSAGT